MRDKGLVLLIKTLDIPKKKKKDALNTNSEIANAQYLTRPILKSLIQV